MKGKLNRDSYNDNNDVIMRPTIQFVCLNEWKLNSLPEHWMDKWMGKQTNKQAKERKQWQERCRTN
ncbi:hypothetical protein BLA29_011074 [Euroglyphus maynei]|uniref:Uncharacterized protein n=1 Tax=Euroglyphus maynei TaxID=6958 RepID=A0A1Y3AT22_EURMA|nr:hypothetical protein BLA29_011074 [Euroglyphus maynei]